MSIRTRALALPLAFAVAALTGCAATGSPEQPAAGDDLTAELAELASLPYEDQRARLAESELALDAYVAAGLGLDEALGTDAASAAQELPRLAAPSEQAAASGFVADLASAVRGAQAPSQGEALGAAMNALSVLQDAIRDGLGEAAQSDESTASHDPAPGDNPSFSWEVFDGYLAGNFGLTASDTGPNGERFELQLDGEYNLQVCPDLAGRTEGYFWVSGSVNVTPEGGATTRAAVELKGDISTQVNDDAYTESVVVESSGDSAFGPPATHPSEVQDSGTRSSTSGTMTIDYGANGAADVSSVTLDSGDGDFGTIVDDLVSQTSQLIVRAQEDWFRDSNCVNLQITPAEYSIQKGESTSITMETVSLADGKPFELGTLRFDSLQGPGSVSPAGEQEPGTEFTYTSDEAGTAEPSFTATSRRGIGRNVTFLTVIEGWTFDDTYADVRTYGTKCDGLAGTWTLTAEGVGWDYAATITVTFDEEDLRGPYTIEGSAGGHDFSGGGEMWLEPVPGGYDLKASTGENVFHVRGATEGQCG